MMEMALNRLEALKEELDMIQVAGETEEKLSTILNHILALENLLKSIKKPVLRLNFSDVVLEDLKKAGVRRKRLIFVQATITELMKSLTTKAEVEIVGLHSRLRKIYTCVNMDHETGSRMVLDTILLTLVEISSTQQTRIAILPGMCITGGGAIQISHPDSGYELWLSGNIDYAFIRYKYAGENKARLLAHGASQQDAFNIANGRLFLVAFKYQSLEQSLSSAISQAIALLKSANLPELRFCLSDGQTWIFFILKSENGTLTYYESVRRYMSRYIVENSDVALREIVQLLCEWVNPTATNLFELK